MSSEELTPDPIPPSSEIISPRNMVLFERYTCVERAPLGLRELEVGVVYRLILAEWLEERMPEGAALRGQHRGKPFEWRGRTRGKEKHMEERAVRTRSRQVRLFLSAGRLVRLVLQPQPDLTPRPGRPRVNIELLVGECQPLNKFLRRL